MKILALSLAISLLLVSCGQNTKTESQTITQEKPQEDSIPQFENKGKQLVYNMTQKVGDYSLLMRKKNVVYTYTYQTHDGKTDTSTEKYIFDGELSYGEYKQHERTFPELDGIIEQGYDGKEFWLKHNGKVLTDAKLLKGVAFNRPTNFYWFTMMQKLMDEGLNYDYLGEETRGNNDYAIVKVSFNLKDKPATDIYQLYINKKTGIVDQFLFTVADFGVIHTPYLMTLEYQNIDGILLPTQRLYSKSTWNADVTDAPSTKVTWSNITFNNNLTVEDFKK